MEHRFDAVLAVVRDSLSVGEVAAAFGVTRQSLYRWMQRYEEGGRPVACRALAPPLNGTELHSLSEMMCQEPSL